MLVAAVALLRCPPAHFPPRSAVASPTLAKGLKHPVLVAAPLCGVERTAPTISLRPAAQTGQRTITGLQPVRQAGPGLVSARFLTLFCINPP